MFSSRPKKKTRAKPVNSARIGHPEEAFVELQLGKSFAASGGDAGNALGATEAIKSHDPASHGHFHPRSALSAFGISRKQMELMGIGERELQDRIYRTLTIWSSSMYDSLFTLSNQNPELADKLWTVYSRLVEVCNPRGAVLSAAQRREFEENMQKASDALERVKMQAEEDRQRLHQRLRDSQRVSESSRKHVATTIPALRAEVVDLKSQLEAERLLSAQRAEELRKVQETSNDVLESLEKTESELAETSHALHRANDQLHLAETEVQRVTQLYKAVEEENQKIRSTFKDAHAKEMRMKGKLEAALVAKESSDKELQDTRKRVQDRGQEAEKLKQALRDANDIRGSALNLLNDAVVKFREVTRCLCESDRTQLDFVRENVEHLALQESKEDMDALHESIHSVLNLTHYISKLPAGVHTGSHATCYKEDVTPGTEMLQVAQVEKELCERVSHWMDHIDSLATNIDRKMVHGFIEHIESIFDSRLGNIERLELAHEKDVVKGAATEVVGNVWIDAVCRQKSVTRQLQSELSACEEDREALREAKATLIEQASAREHELLSLRDIASRVEDSAQRCRHAEEERDTAMQKYAYTAELEREVKDLQGKLSACRTALKGQTEVNKDQSDVLGRLRVDVDKKNAALAEGNTTAVCLMSVLTSLMDESSEQVQMATEGLHSLVQERRPAAVAQELELSSLHAKLNHMHTLENVLLPKERGVVVQVMQNVVSLRSHLFSLLGEANKSLAISAEVGETKQEADSIKAWAARERARLSKMMEEKEEDTRDRIFHLREELTQSELSVKKLKRRVDEAHREKIEMLQTIMELEKAQKQGMAIGGGTTSPTNSPHLQRGALNETLDISAHSPSEPKPSDHTTAPRRGHPALRSSEEQLFDGIDNDDTGSEGGGSPFNDLDLGEDEL